MTESEWGEKYRSQLMEGEPKYRVSLYLRGTPDQFEWNKTELYGFSRHVFAARRMLLMRFQADQKGSASRTIEYALGHTARVVILRVTP